MGGRLKYFYNFWKTLTHDKTILEAIRGYRLDFDDTILQNHFPHPIRCSYTKKQKIDGQIVKFLNSGIIKKVEHCEGEFISQIFSVPKKNGDVRIILNLKPLNQFVTLDDRVFWGQDIPM